jgi:hypothetical protein
LIILAIGVNSLWNLNAMVKKVNPKGNLENFVKFIFLVGGIMMVLYGGFHLLLHLGFPVQGWIKG